MNYYRRYMGDYGRDTGTLTLAEHGAYALLMDHYYSTEEPLPADYADLYRICRAMKKEEQAAVRKVADKFFPKFKDGFRHNDRADEELTKYHAKAEQNRQNGKGGGRPKSNPPDEPKETQSETQSVSESGGEVVSDIEPKQNLIPEARSQKLLRGYSGGRA
jgi:uncharacterized protein YdaU (DUF1376 family)